LDFIRKITAENGTLAYDHQSTIIKNGVREPSFGYCQIHKPSHPAIIADERFFKDPEWQMNICFEKYKGGTPMYATPCPLSEFYWVEYDN